MSGRSKTWSWNTKLEVGNLKLFFCGTQMLIVIMQLNAFTVFKTCRKLNCVCCNYGNFSHHSSFLSLNFFSSSLLSNNSHVPTDNNLLAPTKIKFLIMKLITNVVWKTCWNFLIAPEQEEGLIKGWITFKEFCCLLQIIKNSD